MNEIKTFKVGNKTVKICLDEEPENPRTNDHSDTMICFHKRYSLGDKHDYKYEDYGGWEEFEKQLIKDFDPVEIRPLYMYDHSGLTISSSPFSCPWDSGKIGFILMGKKQARECYMTKRITKEIRERVNKYLNASIEEYDNYLRGSVYGYVIEDENEEHVDSCWGFNGDLDYIEKEAKETAKAIIEQERRATIELVV